MPNSRMKAIMHLSPVPAAAGCDPDAAAAGAVVGAAVLAVRAVAVVRLRLGPQTPVLQAGQ